jgi:chemotaxis protein MotB
MRSRRPRWMTTFGDLMSLLLCFFVLLLSFSEMDRQKYKVVAGSMERAFGMQRKKECLRIAPPWTPDDRQGFRPAVHGHAGKGICRQGN